MLQELGTRASSAIEEIYEDLETQESKIRYIPSSERNALANQVEGLYDVCKMAGASSRHSGECIQALNLSIMSPWSDHHYKISDDAYRCLGDLDSTGKIIRKGGKVLLVAGVVLDVLELLPDVIAEVKDADNKLEKSTWSTLAGIGGSWAGAAAGAKIGALLGAATGLAAPVAIPVLSLVGGIAGSFAGDALGRWVVDITDFGD